MAETEYTTDDSVCAFCGLGDDPAGTDQSHGICGDCYARVVAQIDDLELLVVPGAPHRIALFKVTSDNIFQAGWRDYGGNVGLLVLRFKQNPSTFCYSNVTRTWWNQFWKAESKGAFFYSTVRADEGAHPFVKL